METRCKQTIIISKAKMQGEENLQAYSTPGRLAFRRQASTSNSARPGSANHNASTNNNFQPTDDHNNVLDLIDQLTPRPYTDQNSGDYEVPGISTPLETSRPTFRVSAGRRSMASNSRPTSNKSRQLPAEQPGELRHSDEDEDDEDEDEFSRVQQNNEEPLGRLQNSSFLEHQFQTSQSLGLDASVTSEEDDDEDEEEEEDSFISRFSSKPVQGSMNTPLGSFDMNRQPTGAQNHGRFVHQVNRNSPEMLGHEYGSPEDFFDSELSDEEEEDNEDEVIKRHIKRQHFHQIQLENRREEIRKRLHISQGPAVSGVHRQGYWVYNPADYENLKVSADIKEIFQYITKYSPGNPQVDVKLKPFIPEYYPSVGDIDAFIKVIHPEVKADSLGIKCLDEPSAFQSDPSVLDLRLRALAKQSSAKAVTIKKVDNAVKNSKVIENWINDISDLHRSKPSPSVHYSKPMPDIDQLIQEWPPEIEQLLASVSLPMSDLDCDLATYIDIVCNLLDIPVYKSRIQSLHVLCTLYSTHRNFNQYGNLGPGGAAEGLIIQNASSRETTSSSAGGVGVDRLVL